MKSSKSWDEFNRPDGGESNLKTISLLYFYDLLAPDFPDDVDDFLLALEDKLGGTNASKTPSGSGGSSHLLDPSVWLLASFVVVPLIKKYLDGLLNGDALKGLGEGHRKEIESWFLKLEKDLGTIVLVTNDLLKDYPNAVVCRQQKTDLVLRVDLGCNKLNITLNKNHSDESRAMIPGSIVKAVKHIVEDQTEGNLGDFSLQYDPRSKEWCMYVTTLIKLSEKS